MIFIMLLLLSLLLVNITPIKWLNPIYIEQENKKNIINLALITDSLEGQVNKQTSFIKLIQSIIEGNTTTKYRIEAIDTAKRCVENKISESQKSIEIDTFLHNEFDKINSSLVSTYSNPSDDLKEMFFFTPITGIITSSFDPKIDHYGVDIVANENEPIKCIADGIVMLSSWTLETGWVIASQHSKNIVSIYKHNVALLKKIGSFVKAGDVIAIMGNSGELSTGPHIHFELWYERAPVNPEEFVIF